MLSFYLVSFFFYSFLLSQASFFAGFTASACGRFGLEFWAKKRDVLPFCAYCKKMGAQIWQNRQKCFCRKNRKL